MGKLCIINLVSNLILKSKVTQPYYCLCTFYTTPANTSAANRYTHPYTTPHNIVLYVLFQVKYLPGMSLTFNWAIKTSRKGLILGIGRRRFSNLHKDHHHFNVFHSDFQSYRFSRNWYTCSFHYWHHSKHSKREIHTSYPTTRRSVHGFNSHRCHPSNAIFRVANWNSLTLITMRRVQLEVKQGYVAPCVN